MKKFITAIVLLGSTALAHADYKLVPSDDSDLSKLCLAAAAADTREAMLAVTAAAGIPRSDLPNVRCNGLPIARFALKYGSAKAESLVENSSATGYLLRKSDSSPATELCAAALISEADYTRVKESYFSNDAKIDSEILCNGVPLKSFVRKYRNANLALASSN